MQYRRLGKADIEISAIIFGGWQARKLGWAGVEDAETIAAHRVAFDRKHNSALRNTSPVRPRGNNQTRMEKNRMDSEMEDVEAILERQEVALNLLERLRMGGTDSHWRGRPWRGRASRLSPMADARLH